MCPPIDCIKNDSAENVVTVLVHYNRTVSRRAEQSWNENQRIRFCNAERGNKVCRKQKLAVLFRSEQSLCQALCGPLQEDK